MLAFPTVLLAGAAAVTAVAVPSARSPLVAMSKRTNPPSASFSWQNTSTLFAFGDSYTTTGYNVSAGIDSPDPGYTSSNGKNWIQYLSQTYNVSQDLKLYNLAYGGATIDAKFVTPYKPEVQSLKDQVDLWEKYFSSKPAAAPWTAEASLFTVWIGINDVGNAWGWSNISSASAQNSFYATEQEEYFSLLQTLKSYGAKNFLLLSVPPIQAAPQFVESGEAAQAQVELAVGLFNDRLQDMAGKLRSELGEDGWVGVFDTVPVFKTILDNADVLGFTNTTGFAVEYANGTPLQTTQTQPLLPVSSYLWLNSLHPTWPVHNILAHAVSTFLGRA